MTLVVDASVVVDWVAPDADPGSPSVAALDVLAERDEELIAPGLLTMETSNALLTGIRRGRWNGNDADRARALLSELLVRIVTEERDVVRAWELSRRYDNHPVYDMVYVALAERIGSPLLTADSGLRSRLVGIDWVLGPEDLRSG